MYILTNIIDMFAKSAMPIKHRTKKLTKRIQDASPLNNEPEEELIKHRTRSKSITQVKKVKLLH